MKKCEVYFFFKYFFTLAFVLELILGNAANLLI